MGKNRNRKPKNPLSSIAGAVANGDAVSWDAELAAHPDCAPQLEELRHIQDVFRWYRDAPADGNGSEPTPGAAKAGSGDRTRSGKGGSAMDPAGSESPPRMWGNLRVLKRLKTGGFGDVYQAFEPALRQDVALKLRRADKASDERTVQGFLDEARCLARVRHQNVVVVHGAGVHDGFVGMWMDLVHGRDLEEIVEAHGTFGDREAANVGIAICCGLAELHRVDLLHLDIKPSNVMREEGERGGRILLMDFGSCREIPFPSDLTPDLCVTLRATAPEILRGETPTFASDLYSIGVLLYWLVTERYPYEGRTREELRAQHDAAQPIRLLDIRPDLSREFAEVVEKALSLDPRQRYATPVEMSYALAATLGAGLPPVASDPGTVTVAPPPAPPPPTPWWRHALPWVGGVVVGGLAILLVWLWIGSFRVNTNLYRVATPEREHVTSRSLVRIGDLLFLEIRGSKRMYVYVVQHAGDGKTYSLFPTWTEQKNPLLASILYRLPGKTGKIEQGWGVTSAGGRDTLLVIAASEPLPGVEDRLAKLPQALPDTSVASEPVERGIGQIQPVEIRPEPSGLAGLRRLVSELQAEGVEIRTREIVYPTAEQ